jgi:hypothetical protein
MCCVHYPEEGETHAVDVRTLEEVHRPGGILPEPSVDGW